PRRRSSSRTRPVRHYAPVTLRRSAVLNPCRHCDRAAGRGVLEGVFEQVVEHLGQAVGIAEDRYFLVCRDGETNAGLVGTEAEPLLRGARPRGRAGRLALAREPPRLDPAQVEQVPPQSAHAFGFFADPASRLFGTLRPDERAVDEGTREALDRGERR